MVLCLQRFFYIIKEVGTGILLYASEGFSIFQTQFSYSINEAEYEAPSIELLST